LTSGTEIMTPFVVSVSVMLVYETDASSRLRMSRSPLDFGGGLHDGSYLQVPTAAGRSSIPGSLAVARSSARASWGSSW